MNTRTETDALGPVEVPAESYGGSFLVRARANFKISELRAPDSFKQGLLAIKMAAAEVNGELGYLKPEQVKAILQAGEEFAEGRFDDEYDLDVYQAGAGTPYNMAMNEILANRANEILGGTLGKYEFVHPNNHVNASQSSNDVIPTAIRLGALLDLRGFMRQSADFLKSLEDKSLEFEKVIKIGRTHLQDAVPVTLGQEFWGYASAVKNAMARVDTAATELGNLGIGATATGSGINTHPQFAEKMRAKLSERLGLPFEAHNPFEGNNSMGCFLAVSGALRSLATEILRVCDDLRLMSSGAFGEIQLPEVEPGSSIMPGKVNPSVLECMSMICVQVMGMDHAIALSAQRGQLELNWYTPLIMLDLLHSIQILGNGMDMLRSHCTQGIKANAEDMKTVLENGVGMATALAPYMGYHAVAELVVQAKKERRPFVELVPAEYKKYLELQHMTRPNRS